MLRFLQTMLNFVIACFYNIQIPPHSTLGSEHVLLRRKLPTHALNTLLIEGNSTLVSNVTVYGAIILSSGIHNSNTTLGQIALEREMHARHMCSQLPFPVVEWPGVTTKSCPRVLSGHKTERGLCLAHYQIWLDFIYFDHDILINSAFRSNNSLTSTSYTSTSGDFKYSNGTYYKNGKAISDKDIMVIFEDDADIAIDYTYINETMHEEFSTMTTDLLYLGWCKGRLANPVPLCTHAYAVTRLGAKKLVKYYEPCGLALDEQFVIFGKNNWISYRTAHPWSYKDRLNSVYQHAHDGTHGIFHQKKKDLRSMNGH